MVCEGPVSSFEHEFSAVLVTDPAPAALTGLMPTDAVPSAHFLFLFKYISDCSCPMAFPLIDLTPAEASRGPSWPCARQSPGCLSILTSSPRLTELKDCAGEMSPRQCEDLRGGKVMPTSQPLGAIPACHQGMGRNGEAGTQRQEVDPTLIALKL